MSDITERGSNIVWGCERSSTKGVTFGLDFKRWLTFVRGGLGNSKDMSRVEGVNGGRELRGKDG